MTNINTYKVNSKRMMINIILFLCSYISIGCLDPVVGGKQEIEGEQSKEKDGIGIHNKVIIEDGDIVICELKQADYIKAKFAYRREGERLFTIIDHNQKESLIQLGRDRRVAIRNTEAWPHNMHAHLALRFTKAGGEGSGVLVGPRHILTAAHNVYNHEPEVGPTEWVHQIDVCLGLNGAYKPYGTIAVNRIYTFKAWVDHAEEQCDMATGFR